MNSPSWSKVDLRKTGAVSRMKSFQNWPGSSSCSGAGAEPHQPLLESLLLERPGERLLDHEDDPVAALAEDLADADAVVGRPEGALREEDDRLAAQTGLAVSTRDHARPDGRDSTVEAA